MKPKLPKTVIIGSHTYAVSVKPRAEMYDVDPEEQLLGLCRFTEIEIWLQRGMKRSKTQEILLHEVLHACGYPAMSGAEGQSEESIVDAIAPMLLGVMQKNPSLVAYLS